MGSSNDGPAPAQDAPSGLTDEPPQETGARGFLGRLLSAFSPSSDTDGGTPRAAAPAPSTGLGALRKLRVDDVAIPKTEIVAVPQDIGK